MNITQEILEKSKATKEILSFTKYGEDDIFWCGFVIEYSDKHVAIQHFTKYGKPDGMIIHPLTDFQRIDYNDDYSKAMQIVIDYADEIYKAEKVTVEFGLSETFYLNILKQFSSVKDFLVSVQINNDEFSTGYIQEISETDFSMVCVGKMGEELGNSVFKIEDITSMQIDDVDNRKRHLLYKWRRASL